MAAAVAIGLAGCAHQGTSAGGGDSSVVEQGDLLARAAFEFPCAQEQLTVQDLGGGTTAGVAGCGRRAVYKHLGAGRGWAANTASTEPQR